MRILISPYLVVQTVKDTVKDEVGESVNEQDEGNSCEEDSGEAVEEHRLWSWLDVSSRRRGHTVKVAAGTVAGWHGRRG